MNKIIRIDDESFELVPVIPKEEKHLYRLRFESESEIECWKQYDLTPTQAKATAACIEDLMDCLATVNNGAAANKLNSLEADIVKARKALESLEG